jgi:hypothetical protein
MDWWTYHYKKVWCFQRFVGLDSNAKEISKEEFLQITMEVLFPFVWSLKQSDLYYKLFKIEPTSDTSIQATIAEEAFSTIQNYKRRGNLFCIFFKILR